MDFDESGGVIIDSGTTKTHLNPAAFFPLGNEVQKLMSNFKLLSGDDEYLCYEGEPSKQNLKGFPVVTFEFAGGAELVLEANSMFSSGAIINTFCMAVEKSSGVSRIGLMTNNIITRVMILMSRQYLSIELIVRYVISNSCH